MGPNGSGKSTLAYVLAGRDGYEVTEGSVTLRGPRSAGAGARRARARRRVPRLPVSGRDSRREQHVFPAHGAERACGARAASPSSTPGSSSSSVRAKLKLLEIDDDLLQRDVNVGFSGGEKKRNEIFQMAMLRAAAWRILDETDSGLDIDALKLVAERHQHAARARPRHRGDHALPAAARLCRARPRPCAERRPHRPLRRQEPRRRSSRSTAMPCSEKRGLRRMPWSTSRYRALCRAPSARDCRARAGLARRRAAPAALGALCRRWAFPTRREEAWRFTNLRPLQRDAVSARTIRRRAPIRSTSPSCRATRRADAIASCSSMAAFAPDLSALGALPRRRVARLDRRDAGRAAELARSARSSERSRARASPSPRSMPRSSPTASCSRSSRAWCSTGRSRSSISATRPSAASFHPRNVVAARRRQPARA